jgi:hypothetical protein
MHAGSFYPPHDAVALWDQSASGVAVEFLVGARMALRRARSIFGHMPRQHAAANKSRRAPISTMTCTVAGAAAAMTVFDSAVVRIPDAAVPHTEAVASDIHTRSEPSRFVRRKSRIRIAASTTRPTTVVRASGQSGISGKLLLK